MARITSYFDPIGNTLNIWWGRKKDAHEAYNVKNPNRDDVIIVDKKGRPVSLEIISLFPEELEPIEFLSKKQRKTFLETGTIDLSKLYLPSQVSSK